MSDVVIGYDAEGRMVNMAVCENSAAQSIEFGSYGLATVVIPDTDFLFSQHDHYILNGEVTERPTSPVSRTGLTLLDVPAGSKLTINGVSYDAEGTVELEFPLPGTYSLRVECFPYLDWTDEVAV